jgi:predicted CoA-binding protein
MTTLERIQEFLGHKRLAIVGVSQQPKDFSRAVFREFRNRGYDVVPVNPAVREIEGQRCFARVQDVDPPVSTILVMTPPAVTETVVRDCAEARIERVWMFRGGGTGAVSANALKFCESNGIAVIPGECPFMFLPGGAWFHRLHGFVRKIAGSYPR